MWNWVDPLTCKYPGKLLVSVSWILGQLQLVFCFCDGQCMQQFQNQEGKKHMAYFSEVGGMRVCASRYSCPPTSGTNMRCYLHPSHPPAC